MEAAELSMFRTALFCGALALALTAAPTAIARTQCGEWMCWRCQGDYSYNTNIGPCVECQEGWYFNANKDCVQCRDPLCSKCSSAGSTCVRCMSETWDMENPEQSSMVYKDSRGVCHLCQPDRPGCKRCDGKGVCQACHEGYVLRGGSCTKCPPLCVKCGATADACIACQLYATDVPPGLVVPIVMNSAGQCKKCLVTDCLKCSPEGRCVACIAGYRLGADGRCTQCPNKYCADCSGPDGACKRCLDVYCEYDVCYGNVYKNAQGVCRLCELEGCSKCSPSGGCLQCDTRSLHMPDGTCKPCDKLLKGCTACALGANGAPACRECYEGGLNPQTKRCVACADSRCDTCDKDSTKCIRCKEGTYWSAATGRCKPCKAAHCQLCATDGSCRVCENGYTRIGTSIGACVKCPDASKCYRCGIAPDFSYSCNRCSPDGFTCLECADMGGGRVDSQCRVCADLRCIGCGRGYKTCSHCKEGHYVSKNGTTCLKCTTPHCNVCKDRTDGRCEYCSIGYEATREGTCL